MYKQWFTLAIVALLLIFPSCSDRSPETVDEALAAGVIENREAELQKAVDSLIETASEGYYYRAKELLREGVDIDETNEKGETSLYIALKMGHEELVELLLEKDADVTISTNKGATILGIASDRSTAEIVEKILTKGADVNESMGAISYMAAAAYSGNMDVMRVLMEHGADINLQPEGGPSALHTALLGGNESFVRRQMQEEGIEDIDEKIRKRESLKDQNLSAIKYLLAQGADVNKAIENGNTPLHMAVLFNNIELAKLFIEHDANVNAELTREMAGGFTPLHLAAQTGYMELAELLLDNGADPATKAGNELISFTPLEIAEQNGFNDVVELLREHQG